MAKNVFETGSGRWRELRILQRMDEARVRLWDKDFERKCPRLKTTNRNFRHTAAYIILHAEDPDYDITDEQLLEAMEVLLGHINLPSYPKVSLPIATGFHYLPDELKEAYHRTPAQSNRLPYTVILAQAVTLTMLACAFDKTTNISANIKKTFIDCFKAFEFSTDLIFYPPTTISVWLRRRICAPRGLLARFVSDYFRKFARMRIPPGDFDYIRDVVFGRMEWYGMSSYQTLHKFTMARRGLETTMMLSNLIVSPGFKRLSQLVNIFNYDVIYIKDSHLARIANPYFLEEFNDTNIIECELFVKLLTILSSGKQISDSFWNYLKSNSHFKKINRFQREGESRLDDIKKEAENFYAKNGAVFTPRTDEEIKAYLAMFE